MSASSANYENTVESFLARESFLELPDENKGDLVFTTLIEMSGQETERAN